VSATDDSTTTQAAADARGDFDFLFGRWRLHNRRLDHHMEEESADWVEFDASLEAEPILDGLGNIDRYSAPAVPGGQPLEGFTLRLLDPATGMWSIWWCSTTRPGHMDPPVVGRFRDGRGRFECDDVIGGRPVRVRYDWFPISATSARWEQAFSWDGGHVWKTNWIISLTREGEPAR
jgi:hypothetical protein